jgi:putative flippase GtrA
MSTRHTLPTGRRLMLRYALFCLVSGAVNLCAQAAALRIYHGPFGLTAAMALGTAGGLAVKYILDKRWIFADTATGFSAHGKRFSLYAGTGVATTILFWSTEYLCDALTPDGRYRFAGASIGLIVGYILKFRLDRRFVFTGASA